MMNKVLTNCGHSSWQYNRPITYPITDMSDHLTQFVPIPGDWHTELSSQDIYRRNYKDLNSDKFKEDFNKFNLKNLFSDKNVDDAYDSFLDETEKNH